MNIGQTFITFLCMKFPSSLIWFYENMLGVYIHICGVDLRILHYVFLFLTKKFLDKPKLKLTFKVWGKKLNLEITCDLFLVSYQNISYFMDFYLTRIRQHWDYFWVRWKFYFYEKYYESLIYVALSFWFGFLTYLKIIFASFILQAQLSYFIFQFDQFAMPL